MRPSEVVRRSAAYLDRHGVESPRETAEALLMHFLGTDRAGLYSRSEGLDEPTAKRFGRALCRRCSGTPLQYLTGEQAFMGLLLAVSPEVFIPRPETEGLVEAALEVLEDVGRPLVADVATGTGAVALAIKRARPEARVLATDISPEAVVLARSNADRLSLAVEVFEGDLLDPLPHDLRGHLDLIVSNPPYVTKDEYEALPEEVKAEPYEALVGGTEFHRRLAAEAPSWLAPSGSLVVEIGDTQAREVQAVLQSGGIAASVLPDLAGRDRVVRGREPGSAAPGRGDARFGPGADS